jgi:hypothetical protein
VISLGNPYEPIGEIQRLVHVEGNTFERIEGGESREKWHFELDAAGTARLVKTHEGLYSRIN